MSAARSTDWSRAATSTSSRSPTVWPRLSLTVLNASRSRSSTGGRVVPSALAHRVVDPIGEQRSVGQVGERVVERLVTELGFEPVAMRDVLDRDEHRGASAERELMRVHLDVDAAAVLQLVAPHAGTLHLDPDPELGQEPLGLVVRVDVADAAFEELLAGVAVVMDRGLVHFQERERLFVVYPHRLRVVGEELAGVRFARAELGLTRPQLGLAPLLRRGLGAEQVHDEPDAQRRQRGEPVHVGRAHVRMDPARGDRELPERQPHDRPHEGRAPDARADLLEVARDHERVPDRERRAPADRVDDDRDRHHLDAEQRPELAVGRVGAPQTERDLADDGGAGPERQAAATSGRSPSTPMPCSAANAAAVSALASTIHE